MALEPTIMSKADAAALISAARARTGTTWAELAEVIDAPLVYATAALLGRHPLSKEQAEAACAKLGLDEAVAESLQQLPTRTLDEEIMTDPAIYRFTEALQVYAPAFKELISEEFGDGIMSAINFTVDFKRRPDPDGDRVVVTFDGKFLDFKF